MDVRERTALRDVAVVVLVAAAYFGVGRLLVGLSSAPHDLVEAVWLPSGLAVAALLLFGPSAVVGAFIGSAGLELVAGYPVWAALALGAASAASELLCYCLIVGGGRRAIRIEHSRGVRDLLVAAVAAAALSASIGVICFGAYGDLPFATAEASWLIRFGSVSTGIALLTPAIVYAVRRGRPFGGPLRYLEIALALGMLVTCAFLLQEPTISVLTQDLAVAFAMTAFFWIAFRFTPREMTFAVLTFAAAAIAGVVARHNPVPAGLTVEATLSFQTLLGGIAMIAYFLSSRVARQERSNERARLAAKIYDTTREGIMVTTPDGTITSVNDSFGRITGYTRGDTLGKGPTFMKSDRHPEDFFKGVWDTLVSTGAVGGGGLGPAGRRESRADMAVHLAGQGREG